MRKIGTMAIALFTIVYAEGQEVLFESYVTVDGNYSFNNASVIKVSEDEEFVNIAASLSFFIDESSAVCGQKTSNQYVYLAFTSVGSIGSIQWADNSALTSGIRSFRLLPDINSGLTVMASFPDINRSFTGDFHSQSDCYRIGIGNAVLFNDTNFEYRVDEYCNPVNSIDIFEEVENQYVGITSNFNSSNVHVWDKETLNKVTVWQFPWTPSLAFIDVMNKQIYSVQNYSQGSQYYSCNVQSWNVSGQLETTTQLKSNITSYPSVIVSKSRNYYLYTKGSKEENSIIEVFSREGDLIGSDEVDGQINIIKSLSDDRLMVLVSHLNERGENVLELILYTRELNARSRLNLGMSNYIPSQMFVNQDESEAIITGIVHTDIGPDASKREKNKLMLVLIDLTDMDESTQSGTTLIKQLEISKD
jgi:hypothetical protein